MNEFTAKLLILLTLNIQFVCSQNNALVINDNAFVVLNGGTAANPAHIVINQPHANGIVTTGTGGNLVSENEYNYVKWNVSNNTGNYTIPYTSGAPVVQKMPLSVNITTPGSVGGHILHATYRTNAMNLPWPSSVNHMFDANTGTLNNSLFVVDRFWIIDAMNYTTRPDVNMSFGYVTNALEVGLPNTITLGNLGAQRFNTTNNHWEGIISFGIPSGIFGIDNGIGTVSNVMMNGADLFRTWTLADKSSPLPIALLAFEANCVGNGTAVSWQTASETNNDYFELLRSNDGINFTAIAQIPGSGNSNATQNYIYTDELSSYDFTVYKLLQYDFDGSVHHVALKQSAPCVNGSDIHVYNGYGNEIIVDFEAVFNQKIEIKLYDVAGRLIDNFGQFSVVEGSNQLRMLHSDVAFGSYFIAIKTANQTYNKQLILK